MPQHLFSSWEIIMPQSVAISTGDIHVDQGERLTEGLQFSQGAIFIAKSTPI